jgi:hypothetical protein
LQLQISAVVFLADGDECRCIQLSPKAKVGDIVDHMLEVCWGGCVCCLSWRKWRS